MKNLFENWKKYITEEEINEVNEEELSHIEDVLYNLKYDDLPFGNMFGEKTRLVQPMVTKDEDMEHLKELLQKSGYVPDFATGKAIYYTVTFPATKEGERPSTMMLTTDQHDLLKKGPRDTEEKYKERLKNIRKREVSIGKLLQKGSRLFDIAKNSQEKFENTRPEDFKVSPDQVSPDDEASVAKYREASEKAEAEANKDFSKLTDLFPGGVKPIMMDPVNKFKELAEWWNKKSTFYRENPEAADKGTASDEFSIVYSRHPIDVLRMSDFDSIESCHSPRSRGGSGEYYKCAVAEAHGHGAIAYVVKNEDLNGIIEKGEDWLDVAPGDFQAVLDTMDEVDEELFWDDERSAGKITPVSRVRIRQYGHPGLGIRMAVPEQRLYGEKNPAFLKQVMTWAQENQKDVIEKVLNSKDSADEDQNAFDGEYLNLRSWERYGGSYQDTRDPEMFSAFLGLKSSGYSSHDSTTEDSLHVHGSLIDEWQVEVDNIVDNSNRRFQAAQIRGSVENDGGDGAYVDVDAELIIKIPESEFKHSAFQNVTVKAMSYIDSHLHDYGMDWPNDPIRHRVQDGNVEIHIPINIEAISEEGTGYAYDPHSFQEIANAVDRIDDDADTVESLIRGYLKREGIMEGAALYELASALEGETWYEWDYDMDDDYEPTSISITTKQYVNLDDLIQKMPVKLERGGAQASEGIKILFDGSEIARAYEATDGEGNFKWWDIVSEEFQNEKLGGFKNAEEIESYSRHEIAKLIVGPTLPGSRVSRDYSIVVRIMFRDAVGGVEGEFKYPYTEVESGGMDADDEWTLKFTMNLDDDDGDDIVENAHKIIAEVDDEDEIKDIFRAAFARVAKVASPKVENLREVKKYFNKFDFLS